MIPRIPHPLTPRHLPSLKQKLPSNLSRRAAAQHLPSGKYLFIEALKNEREEGFLDIVWILWA